MWTVNLNFHYSNIFTDSPWITWFLCLWGWTTTLIWLDFLLPFPQRSLIGGRMQEERLCPLSASVEPTDMPRPQSFPAKSWISVNFRLFLSHSSASLYDVWWLYGTVLLLVDLNLVTLLAPSQSWGLSRGRWERRWNWPSWPSFATSGDICTTNVTTLHRVDAGGLLPRVFLYF